MAQARGVTPRATSLNGPVADNAQQAIEPDPSDALIDDDVDAVMAKLINQAPPEKRAELNALDPEQRRELVATYQDQERDHEPSPVEDDPPGQRPHKPKQFKRV